MKIKFRAVSTFNKQTVEQDISTDLMLGNPNGIQCRCDPATLEIVIDNQAVKVAKIKELMKLKDEIKSIITLYYNDCYNGNIIDEITELINILEDKSND